MIKFNSVYSQQIKNFYSVYNANYIIDKNTLFIGDIIDGSYSIMRMLAKIEKEYKGEILVDEKNLKTMKDKDLPIAYVAHDFELFENKTIFENLFFPLKIRKINKNYAKNLIFDEIFKHYSIFNKNFKLNSENKNEEINKILNTKIKFLNKSQKKLVTLLRATLRQPKYLLIEDFFSNLDNVYFETAFEIINNAATYSTIIACENEDNKIECFNSFEKIYLRKNPAD